MPEQSEKEILSRRKFLATSAGVAGTAVSGRALADMLADAPARELGHL